MKHASKNTTFKKINQQKYTETKFAESFKISRALIKYGIITSIAFKPYKKESQLVLFCLTK